jgi:hypothetical protein
MKRLGLSLLLALGLFAGGCSTTSQWQNQLDQYRSGRLEPDNSRKHRADLRTEQQKRNDAAGRAATEVASWGVILLLALF